jgi:hypothetical protein
VLAAAFRSYLEIAAAEQGIEAASFDPRRDHNGELEGAEA